MRALLRNAVACTAVVMALAAAPVAAQELAGPAQDLVIAWRSPAVPSMPTVTWAIAASRDEVSTVRTEARTLIERMTTEGTTYRAIFPLRHVDPFGSIYEFEFEHAAVDAIGRLDEGKVVRIPVKAIATLTNSQTKQQMRNEYSGATVLTVEKHETIEVPAGRFETIVIRMEGDAPAARLPPGHRTFRRYWYAPALGWYVRHEVVITGPAINQRNEYVAARITKGERAEQR